MFQLIITRVLYIIFLPDDDVSIEDPNPPPEQDDVESDEGEDEEEYCEDGDDDINSSSHVEDLAESSDD